MIIAFCTFSDGPLSMYQVSFNLIPLYTFRDILRTNFSLQTMKKGSNSVNNNDRIMILALCTSADGPLSMYQFSFNSLVYFQRYAQDKLYIAKMKKGSTSVNIVDRVMILALCDSLHGPLSVYQVSFIYL